MTPALSNFRRALTITERVIPTRSAILLATRIPSDAVQLVKDVNDGFQLGEGQGVDGRFYDLDLAVLLRVLLMNGTHHLQAHNGGAILT